ncbi:MAG: hypothetical protein HEP71_22465 [Roseivirga sp.]|nr:hypothetical protein [Roseivirga sp.]
MRKLKIMSSLLATILALGMFYSCDDNSEVDPLLDDSELIAAIATAANRQDISTNALPSNALTTLEDTMTFITNSVLAPELGYEVRTIVQRGADVGESSSAYFNLDGRELLTRNAFRPGDRRIRNGQRNGRRARGLRDCFDFVFPVSLTMPDASTITLESDDDWSLIREWYQANPDAEGRPTFVFPFEVTFGDETITISNEEDLESAKSNCEVDRRRGRCFELEFPVTFTMPDATEITLASRDDWSLIHAWYEANPDATDKPDLVYPVNITYRNDSTITVNSEEEMRAARAICEVDRGRDRCFQPVFPLSFTMPDGTEITLASRDDWQLIKDWYEANPEAEERPDLVFPIEITFEDGSTMIINSEEELQEAKRNCG